MFKSIKQITQDLEEYLLNYTDTVFGNEKSDWYFLNYRLSLFKIILFSIVHKKIKLLKNNNNTNSDIVKSTMVVFNNMVTEMNNRFLNFKFEKFNLELTKHVPISISNKKNPYKKLNIFCDNIELINEEQDLGSPCKPVSGLLTVIIFHKTKTKQELSINLLSDIRSKNNDITLNDVTEIILLKNNIILKELEHIINSYLKPKLKKDIISNLVSDKKFEDVESDMYYGFIGALTLNDQNIEDIGLVYDMLYYPDKIYKPYLKLYFEVFQYKKMSSRVIYNDIGNLNFKQYHTILKQESVLYNKDSLKQKACLFIENNHVSLKTYSFLNVKVADIQNCNKRTSSTNRVNVMFLFNNKNHEIYLFSKDILYNNIDIGSYITIYNGRNLLYKHVFYEKNVIQKNSLFNIIKEKYVLVNNNILLKKNESLCNKGLSILFKINQNHIPWDEFNRFIEERKLNISDSSPNDIFEILSLYKKENNVIGTIIFNKLIYSSLSEIFNDIYSNKNITIETFEKFYEENLIIEDCKLISKSNSKLDSKEVEEKKEMFKDFLFIFEILLLLIKHN